MRDPRLRRITIDEHVADSAIARRYAAYADSAGVEARVVADAGDIHDGHTLSSGKQEIHVTRAKGAAVKQCTGLEPSYVCCNLHVVNQTTNCPLDCSYCILQAYLNQPVTTVASNVPEMVASLEAQSAAQPGRLFRVGTGDLGDALALDPLGGVTAELVPRVAALPNVVLELKTKSDAVEQLLELDHRGRVVVAWSMNPQHIIATEEHKCASLDERLAAARRVIEAGYPVAFHFDPMIVHPGWEESYPALARRIFESVPAERVAWVSMGGLRFPPSMRDSIERRFPKSRLPLGELHVASDGKMRYVKPVRIGLFSAMYAALQAGPGAEVFTYLCMEAPEVWRRVLGYVPESNNDLDFRFSSSVVRRFPHLLAEAPRWESYAGATNLGADATEAAP